LQYTNIVGGSGNSIVNNDQVEEKGYSSILGGTANTISGIFSNILGGSNNFVSGAYSTALGKNISIKNSGSMVFSDSSTGLKNISQENTMFLNFANGVCITGTQSGNAPIVFDIAKLPTQSSSVPIGGIYRSGDFIKIRLS
jgi:hypothetical protein